MLQYLRFFVVGIVLGIANVIPGISGGTLAVVCNVYDRLIGAITLNIKKILTELPFLLSIGIGLIVGIIGFSKIITFLFEYYAIPTNFFFMGIILGSIPLIFNRVQGHDSKKASLSLVLCVCVGFAIMIAMEIINPDVISNTIETQLTLLLAIKLFFGSFCAAIAMIIPGISGSLLLLLIGSYATTIAAVSNFNIPFLILIALGVIAGLLCGAGFVRFLMAKIPHHTYAVILGLVAGSVFVLYPGFPSGWAILISLLTCALGFTLSFFFSHEKKNKKMP